MTLKAVLLTIFELGQTWGDKRIESGDAKPSKSRGYGIEEIGERWWYLNKRFVEGVKKKEVQAEWGQSMNEQRGIGQLEPGRKDGENGAAGNLRSWAVWSCQCSGKCGWSCAVMVMWLYVTAFLAALALLSACGNMVSGVDLSLIPISRAQGALVWKHLLLRRCLGLSLSQSRMTPSFL
jgi:hypothetical protein